MNALVYAPNWLGDAVMAMPALQVWRERHPGDRLTVLTKRGNAPLWKMHPAVDEVVVLEPGTRGTFRTGRALRESHFDIAYLMPNSFRSALVAFWARIPKRRGVGRHARSLLLTERVRLSTAPGDYHQSRETAPILLGTDLPAALPAPDLRVPRELLAETLAKFGLPDRSTDRQTDGRTDRIVAIIPGAARGDSKRWPHFADAARMLAEGDETLRFAVLGTVAESPLCQQVVEALPEGRGVNVAGKTTMPEFAALLAAADVVLCNDSGGMHLAAAVGSRVVPVFGLTDWRRTGPLGDRYALVRRDDVQGRRAIARSSRKAAEVLVSIPAERVAAVAQFLLKR